MKLVITRQPSDDKQTLGIMQILDEHDNEITQFKTLELPWLDNARRISCIPIGKYQVVKRWSEKYNNHFNILDVPNRSYILIHSGNYHQHTLGCILVGNAHADINGDGYSDVINSRNAMKMLLSILPDRFEIEIR